MVTKACYWCKKEDNAFLIFFKPRGWIKHKTPDELNLLFCSLACFKAFSGADEALPKSTKPKKPIEVKEEEWIAAPAQ